MGSLAEGDYLSSVSRLFYGEVRIAAPEALMTHDLCPRGDLHPHRRIVLKVMQRPKTSKSDEVFHVLYNLSFLVYSVCYH